MPWAAGVRRLGRWHVEVRVSLVRWTGVPNYGAATELSKLEAGLWLSVHFRGFESKRESDPGFGR